MQTGFCMLTAGSVRTKNVMNVLLKNMLDCCTGAIVFFLFGYAFAHGEESNRFIGYSQFALTRFDNFSHAVFFFRWTLSAASTTVVSGAIAERATFYAYLIYSVCISGFLYPVISHGVWDVNGWLSAHRPDPVLGIGMIDFGGSAVVHMSAGLCGFLGTLIIGPRIGRFDSNGKPVAIAGHSASLVVLGTLLLCTGAFGFNAGSMLHVATRADHELFGGRNIVLSTGESVLVSPTMTVSRCLVTTLLGAAMSALVGLVISKWVLKVFDLIFICNCLLGGLVSITAGCATLEPYAAMCVGGFSAVVYFLGSRLVLRIRVDDPVDASAVHFGCGLWGVLAVGLFSSERLQAGAGFPVTHFGLVHGGDWALLGCQVIGMASVIGSVTATCVPLFLLLRAFGILRVSAEQEEKGID
ncbi:hypothetical protein BU14_0027s0002 [Porphyra umbilicalis]|uniref:Ammonium transporter AmtB-like domain-containing protein n=1 Tax=Porphyra umbilicalis TaxID=2786 RepID=A0A1X6PJN4_PORUM|nr:hypothetical protein BU14_0027s0002 [Porphyra umbilicalis]|eukprot:OSX80976.1 hypothetical protein BU14_0027s0002 [Porphyra umbilicalis]